MGLHTKPSIINQDIQQERRVRPLPAGPRGVIHDYLPFYFGYLSPMLLQLQTGVSRGMMRDSRV
jgi:hypothetical protein